MKKIKPLMKGSVTRRILRALKQPGDTDWPIESREEACVEVSVTSSCYDHNMLKNAVLEAEQAKARGVEAQKHRFIH